MIMDINAVEERFTSAVEIIKNLPKSGSIQPSNETKLKFYSYYKQATEGPCESNRPGMWNIVNRAKWDAWHKLGNMSKEEAMRNYVQEFVKIIQETPLESLDDPSIVNDFLGLMGPYIEYAPEEIKKKHLLINGKANKPLNNNSEDYVEEYSGSRSPISSKDYSNRISDDGSDLYSSPVNGHSQNGGNESDSDIFSDTLEGVNEEDLEVTNSKPAYNNPVPQDKGPNIVNIRGGDNRPGNRNGNSPANASGGRGNPPSQQLSGSNWTLQAAPQNVFLGSSGGSRRSGGGLPSELSGDVNEQLALAVIRLQHTMEQVVVRLDSLEALLTQRNVNPSMQVATKKTSPRWSVFGMSPKLAFLIFTWPFIVQLIIYYVRKRQRRLL